MLTENLNKSLTADDHFVTDTKKINPTKLLTSK